MRIVIILLTTLLVLVVGLYIFERSKRKRAESMIGQMGSRFATIKEIREQIAHELLLILIDSSKIMYIPKQKNPVVSLSSNEKQGSDFYGLIASGLNGEEMRFMDMMNRLCEGRILRYRGMFRIPGKATQEEIKRFTARYHIK